VTPTTPHCQKEAQWTPSNLGAPGGLPPCATYWGDDHPRSLCSRFRATLAGGRRQQPGPVRIQPSRYGGVLAAWGRPPRGCETPGRGWLRACLDIGGGNGALARELAKVGVHCITADRASYVADAPPPVLRADATELPVRGASFSGVAASCALYHLAVPTLALNEMRRCLRPGGVAVVCAPSRYNGPELSDVLPRWGNPSALMPRTAPIRLQRRLAKCWSRPGTRRCWRSQAPKNLRCEELALFLRGRGLAESDATEAAHQVETPLIVTKRGMFAWARR
jgi:SAM-dependent methyltransferase